MEVKPFFAAEQGRDYMLLAYKFENGSSAELSDYYSDYGVDDDKNGLYDHIDIAVGVNVKTQDGFLLADLLVILKRTRASSPSTRHI